jgi:hypothetical protein
MISKRLNFRMRARLHKSKSLWGLNQNQSNAGQTVIWVAEYLNTLRKYLIVLILHSVRVHHSSPLTENMMVLYDYVIAFEFPMDAKVRRHVTLVVIIFGHRLVYRWHLSGTLMELIWYLGGTYKALTWALLIWLLNGTPTALIWHLRL